MIPRKIDSIYAWICTDDDGSEGVPAITLGEWIMPMIGADNERIESFRGVAENIGKPVKLVKFSTMEVLETLNQKEEAKA